MENYSKARTLEQPSVCPFSRLPAGTPQIRVRDGSKIRNLLRFVLSRLEEEEEEGGRPRAEGGDQQGAPGRQVVFTATGKAVSKAITCAEIVKRRVKRLHQLTRLQFGAVVEEWEPLEPAAGLDTLTVRRNLPSIWILLSADPLDAGEPGYQAPGRYDALWAPAAGREEAGGPAVQRPGHRRRRGGAAGGGGGGRGGKASHRQTGRSREPVKGQT